MPKLETCLEAFYNKRVYFERKFGRLPDCSVSPHHKHAEIRGRPGIITVLGK